MTAGGPAAARGAGRRSSAGGRTQARPAVAGQDAEPAAAPVHRAQREAGACGRCRGRSHAGRGTGRGTGRGRRAGGVRGSAPAQQRGRRSRSRSPGGGRVGAGSGDMGSADSKLNFRKAVIQLTTKTQVRRAPAFPIHLPGSGAALTCLASP